MVQIIESIIHIPIPHKGGFTDDKGDKDSLSQFVDKYQPDNSVMAAEFQRDIHLLLTNTAIHYGNALQQHNTATIALGSNPYVPAPKFVSGTDRVEDPENGDRVFVHICGFIDDNGAWQTISQHKTVAEAQHRANKLNHTWFQELQKNNEHLPEITFIGNAPEDRGESILERITSFLVRLLTR